MAGEVKTPQEFSLQLEGVAADAKRPRRSDYLALKHLGEGSVGAVTKVMHRSSGRIYALKVIDKQHILEHDLGAQLLQEVQTQLKVKHPNLLRCHDYFEDEGSVFLVLEFATGGDLHRHLKRKGPMSEPDAAYVLAQVAEGVRHLHSLGIIHRDLKSENILLDFNLTVKVADFGWCAQAQGRTTFCGTLCMLAPEMVIGKPYDAGVDIWALGVLLFEMLTVCSPFDQGGSLMETCDNIVRKKIDSALLEKVPETTHSLLHGLLEKEASKRLSIDEVLRHPWLTEQRQKFVPEPEPAGPALVPQVSSAPSPSPLVASAAVTGLGMVTELNNKAPAAPPAAPSAAEAKKGLSSVADWSIPPTHELLVERLPAPASGSGRSSSSKEASPPRPAAKQEPQFFSIGTSACLEPPSASSPSSSSLDVPAAQLPGSQPVAPAADGRPSAIAAVAADSVPPRQAPPQASAQAPAQPAQPAQAPAQAPKVSLQPARQEAQPSRPSVDPRSSGISFPEQKSDSPERSARAPSGPTGLPADRGEPRGSGPPEAYSPVASLQAVAGNSDKVSNRRGYLMCLHPAEPPADATSSGLAYGQAVEASSASSPQPLPNLTRPPMVAQQPQPTAASPVPIANARLPGTATKLEVLGAPKLPLQTYERLFLEVEGGYPGGSGGFPGGSGAAPSWQPVGNSDRVPAAVPAVVRHDLRGPQAKSMARRVPETPQYLGNMEAAPPDPNFRVGPWQAQGAQRAQGAQGAQVAMHQRRPQDFIEERWEEEDEAAGHDWHAELGNDANRGWFDEALNWVGLGSGAEQEAPAPAAAAPVVAQSPADLESKSQQLALAAQVVELGFSRRQADEAAKRTSSVEAAVEWIVQSGL